MDFKFIVAADIHLDSPLIGLSRYEGAPVDVLRGATREAFGNLINLAVEEKAAFVLISGDLYDGDWRDYNTGLFLSLQLARLREAGIRVFILHGNHDAESRITRSLRLPDNVRVLSSKQPETVLLEDLGVAIHGQGFARRDEVRDLAEGYPEAARRFFNIGMLHTALTGAAGHEPYAPCSLGTLQAKGYDVWALGHVHTRRILSDDPLILFPGNTQGRHARETGAKGCTLVTVEDGRIRSHEPRDLHVVRWEAISADVSGSATAAEVVDAVQAVVEKELGKGSGEVLAARLNIEGTCPAHGELLADPEKWTAEIRAVVAAATGEGAWVEKVRFQTGSGTDRGRARGEADPLMDLVRTIDGLADSDEWRSWLHEDMKMLKEKLPPELFLGEGPADLSAGEDREQILRDVKGLLTYRIMEKGAKK
jgi:DNA repair protein SbcD/Mre11